MSKEVAEEYLSSLTDLTFNSKPLINMLTMLAEENVDHAPAIVQAIESHIEKVSPEVKLPVLYLIDSIVKNVGPVYVPLFTQNIVRIFASVFEKVDEKTRASMFKVRGTWNTIFPSNKLHMLDLRIQHVDENWPLLAPPPTPSIHVNPRFLQQQAAGNTAPAPATPPVPAPHINPAVVDPGELQATYLKKQQILLELQEKKKQLETLQKQVDESLQKKADGPLQKQSDHIPARGRNNNKAPKTAPPLASQTSPVKTKIATPTSMLIEAAKSRDPRLARMRREKGLDDAHKQESDEEEQRRNLKLDMLRRSELAKAQAQSAPPKVADPRMERKVQEVKPEIKKTENDIQLRQTAMLKAPVLAQLNHSESKNDGSKAKRRRSPEDKDFRNRREKLDSPKLEERQFKETKPPRKSRENKSAKNVQKRKAAENKYERIKDKRQKERRKDDRSTFSPPTSSPSPPLPSMVADENEEYNPATFVPEKPPEPVVKSPVKVKSILVETITPEPPPPPVIRQAPLKIPEAELEDEDIIREEVLRSQPQMEPVGFKHLKKAAKGRNYSRRNKERSRSPTPPLPTDVDLRIGATDPSCVTEDSPVRERSGDAENLVDVAKDVDFRLLNVGSPSQKRLSTDARQDEPPAKKGKIDSADPIQLFGMKDMDERMIPASRLPSPPPPPVISSAPSSPQKPVTPLAAVVEEEDVLVPKEEPSRNLSTWADVKPRVEPDAKPLLLSSQLELQVANLEREEGQRPLKSPVIRERDRLGRPLLYDKLPTDPLARRESLGSQASHEDNCDTDLRRDDDFQMENFENILAQANEQFKSGQMSREQLNQLMSQIVRLSEEQKIRDAKRMGQKSRPFGNRSPQYEGTNRQRFGDMDYRHGGQSRPWRGQFRGRWRGEGGRGRGHGGHDNGSFPPEHRRRENRFGRPERSPEYFDTDSKSQEAWEDHPDLPNIPPTDPAELEAIAADPVKFIAIDGTPRPIRFYGFVAVYMVSFSQAREISFENGVRCVMIAGLEVPCQINGPPVNFIFKNKSHSVRLGAPTRELYVDNRFYEVHFGGPPVQTDLSGVLCSAQLQGPPPQVKFALRNSSYCLGIVHLIVDAHKSFQIFLDAKPQRFDVDGLPFILKLANALTTVLINNVEVGLKFGGVAVPVWVSGSQHFLRLTELPPGVIPGRVSIQGMENVKESSVDIHDSNSGDARLEEPPKTSSDVNREMYFDMLNSTMCSIPKEEKAIGFNYQVDPSEPVPVHAPPPAAHVPLFTTPPPRAQGVKGLPTPNLNVNDLLQSLLTTGLIGSKPEPKPPIGDHRVKRVSFSDTNSLRERQPGLVAFLYSGIQCGSCGVRFSPDETVKYSQHLDWHFRQNRRDRDAAKRGASRRWYYDMSDWIQFEEIEDLEERAQSWFETEAQGQNEEGMEEEAIKSVPAPTGGATVTCNICHDKFDTFFHQETEEWHLRNCITIEEKYYHPTCYKDSLKEPEEPLAIEKIAISEPPLLASTKTEPKIEVDESIIIVEDLDDDDDDDVNDGEIEVVTADEEAILEVIKGLIDYVIAEEDCDMRGPIEDDELEVLAVTNKDENKPPVELIDVPETGDDDVYYPPSPEVFDPDKPIKPEPMDEMESALAQVDQTVTDVVTSIDGNVVMAEAPQAAAPTQSKIKITFNKPTQPPEPVKEKAPEPNDDPTDLQIEEVDPEPLPLKPKKPRIAEKEMTVYPPCKRGTEISGLCSIM